MRYLISLSFFLISMIGLGQPTYLDLFIQFDQYPSETSWLVTSGNDTIYSSPSYDFQEYVNSTVEQRLFLESGVEYKFYMNDTFGDGICCDYGPGYFTLENECQGLIVEDLEFGQNSIDYSFTLSPCIPEIPTANVLFRVDLANAPPSIGTPGVLGSWNGWQVIPMTYDENEEWFLEVEVPLGNHLWKFADFNDPNIQELPVGIDGGSCFLFDGNGFVNRTINITSEEQVILPPYCWESCLPCGGIAGCSDPSAPNWNPWANFDDGSCVSQNIECAPGESVLEIVVTPDNFGGETSWLLYGPGDQVYATAPAGTYAGSPAGVPISTEVCVTTGGEYDLVIEDSFGDGLCGPCATNNPNLVTGNVEILDCDGEVLWSLLDEKEDGNFGYNITSALVSPSTSCGLISVIAGCTDPAYVEYNPEATTFLAGSCVTPVVVGCTDPTQFNFNPEANTEEIIESCEFTLTIKDGVGDGWFGSWLGIYQLGTIFNSPQYQMGPNDGTELSFDISGLDATQPAYFYFFVTPQSIGTAQQCGFTLTNSNGDVIIDVPFFNIIPFINESGWYRYEVTPYCGNTCIPYIEGCTAPAAINYNDEANTNDGSCIYFPGCTNPAYVEYSEEADVDDGSCSTLVVFGCTDPDAFNFDEEANTDNDGCIPKIFGCTNPLAFNFDQNANTPDGSCIAIQEGCTDPSAFNYEENANTDDGSCVEVIFGCTLDGSFNFDPLANTDNGSCIPKVLGCMDDTALNFNPDANIEDGSCITAIYGCTDSTAFNYNELANVDNESCIEVIEGCMDPLALNFDPLANVNNFECTIPEYGCTDPTALNFNELANVDNGTCIQVVEGCTNPEALNFDESANVDDFSCILPIYGCTDPTAFNYNELANIDNDSCEEVVEGCTDPEALNYNELANVDDFSCILPIYGCTDPEAFNFNELATVDNGTCIEIVEGCTDPSAFNFNPEANTEDFSCEPFIYGCTDPQAANYDEEANTDNGTCETVYQGCVDQTVESYNLLDPVNSQCFAWVLDVSPDCCDNEWNTGCQSLYEYCFENGETTNVNEILNQQIIVYPNPTLDIINFSSQINFTTSLFNSMGQKIIDLNNPQLLDMSKYESGVYQLIIDVNGNQFSKKIIKQ